jgi:hypothetical protein
MVLPGLMAFYKFIMAMYEVVRVETKHFYINCNRKEVCIQCMISENFLSCSKQQFHINYVYCTVYVYYSHSP